MIEKYAKDLQKGDKINGHEKGWITVQSVKRIHLSSFTEIYFEGDKDAHTYDSHTVFDVIER